MHYAAEVANAFKKRSRMDCFAWNWKFLPSGQIKINTDGSSVDHGSLARDDGWKDFVAA